MMLQTVSTSTVSSLTATTTTILTRDVNANDVVVANAHVGRNDDVDGTNARDASATEGKDVAATKLT